MTSLHGSTVASVVRHKQKQQQQQQHRSLTVTRGVSGSSSGSASTLGLGLGGGAGGSGAGGGGGGTKGVDHRRSTFSLHNPNVRHFPARALNSDTGDRTLIALAPVRTAREPESETLLQQQPHPHQPQQQSRKSEPSLQCDRYVNKFINPSILIVGCQEGATGPGPVDPYNMTNSASYGYSTSNAAQYTNSNSYSSDTMHKSWACPTSNTPPQGTTSDGPIHFTFAPPAKSTPYTAAGAPNCSSSATLAAAINSTGAFSVLSPLTPSATSLRMQSSVDLLTPSSLDLRPPIASCSSFSLRSGAQAPALKTQLPDDRVQQHQQRQRANAVDFTDMDCTRIRTRTPNSDLVDQQDASTRLSAILHKTCTVPSPFERAGHSPSPGACALEEEFGDVMPLGQRPTSFYRGRGANEVIQGRRRKSESFDANAISRAHSRHYQQPHCLLRFGANEMVSEVAECEWVDLERHAEAAGGVASEATALHKRSKMLNRSARQSTISLTDEPLTYFMLHHQPHVGSPELVAPASTPIASPTAGKHACYDESSVPSAAELPPPYLQPQPTATAQPSSFALRMNFREQITSIFQSTMLEHNRPTSRRRLQRLRHLPKDSAVSVSPTGPGGSAPGGGLPEPGASAGTEAVDGKAADADGLEEEIDPRKFCLLIHPNSAFRYACVTHKSLSLYS